METTILLYSGVTFIISLILIALNMRRFLKNLDGNTFQAAVTIHIIAGGIAGITGLIFVITFVVWLLKSSLAL